MPKEKKGRVLVAMSGGIDSAVAAMLLKKEGYEVVGVTMKTWDYQRVCSTKKQIGCCNLDSIEDAREVAAAFDFPYMVLDIREQFDKKVIQTFTQEYLSGRTPNPCILCNTHMKWEALLHHANQLQCPYIATGHHATIAQDPTTQRYYISTGRDSNKDQSYALWGISQENLSRTLLPLQGMTKPEVRTYAARYGFDNLVKKSESYEICFIPDNDYRGFLKRRTNPMDKRVQPGDFILKDGTKIGKHQGYPFYTVGQRKGLGIALGYPVYVTEIRPETNQIVLGKLNQLARDGMIVNRLNWMKYTQLTDPIEALTKVRYNDQGTPALLIPDGAQQVKVHFKQPVYGVAPGQAAVFYQGNDLLGGGWIQSAFNQEH